MKKTYIKPQTETVLLNLSCSVLTEGAYGNWSNGAAGEYGDSKENNGLWDDVDDDEPWSSVTESSNDLWGSDENEDE